MASLNVTEFLRLSTESFDLSGNDRNKDLSIHRPEHNCHKWPSCSVYIPAYLIGMYTCASNILKLSPVDIDALKDKFVDYQIFNMRIMKLVCMSFSCFSSFVHETKTRFSRWGVSVVWRTGPLTMTFSAFLVVIDIHRACCSEFAVTVIMPAIYIDLASH